MYIYYSKSLQKIRSYIEKYNAQYQYLDVKDKCIKDHSKLLKPTHRDFYFELIKLLAKKVNKSTEAYTNDTPNMILTNSFQLSKRVGWSKRTIFNYLNRLEQAQLLKKKFRGSRYSYEIHINKAVLYTTINVKQEVYQNQLNQSVVEAQFNQIMRHIQTKMSPKKDTSEPIDLSTKKKNLPHNIDTRNLNKLSLITKVDKTLDSSYSIPIPNNETSFTSKHLKQAISQSKKEEKKLKGIKTILNETKKVAPKKDESNAYDHIYQFVQVLWQLMYSKLYVHTHSYLAPAQVMHAQQYFADKLLCSNDIIFEFEQLKKRIILVDKYVNKVNKPSFNVQNNVQKLQKRYIPIPTTYLNDNNIHGFSKSKKWLSQNKIQDQTMQSLIDQSDKERKLYLAFKKAILPVIDTNFLCYKTYKASYKKLSKLNNRPVLDAFLKYVSNKHYTTNH